MESVIERIKYLEQALEGIKADEKSGTRRYSLFNKEYINDQLEFLISILPTNEGTKPWK